MPMERHRTGSPHYRFFCAAPNPMFMPSRGAWIRSTRGQFSYRGRITRGPFDDWLKTPEGPNTLAAAAARVRFALFSKKNVARRRLWRGLASAARHESVASAIQREIETYFARIGELVYGDGLPRTAIDLYRLVALPCVVVNAATCQNLKKRLLRVPAVAALFDA